MDGFTAERGRPTLGGRIYMDYNATAPVRPEAAEAMARALVQGGNPSSVHAEGREARKLVEEARARVAALVGVQPRQVVFTSGGTEANNWVLSPATQLARCKIGTRLCLISAIEHPSVAQGHRFHPALVNEIPVGESGLVDLAALTRLLDRAEHEAPGSSVLVSVMLANNETGVIQPIAEIARITRERGHILHTDAVQAAGKMPLDIASLGADLMTVSGHKIGGPQGIGAVILAEDERISLDPMLKGGGQERSRRAGTENVAAIVGFGVAAEIARLELDDFHRVSGLRASLEAGLVTISPEATVFGDAAPRLANTTCFTAPGLNAETAIIAFDLAGIAVSSGAACSSGKVAASRVLQAMGVSPATARGAIRVSLGWQSTMAEIDAFLAVWRNIYAGIVAKREAAAA